MSVSSSKFRELLRQVPEVIAIDIEREKDVDYLTILVDSVQVELTSLTQVEQKIAKAINVEHEVPLQMVIRPVRLVSPIETLKNQCEEFPGVLGVYTAPREWDANRRPTVIGFVIKVDASDFDAESFQKSFSKLAQLHGVRVRLKVDFVKYIPESSLGGSGKILTL